MKAPWHSDKVVHLQDQAEMARYVRLPLGNFGSDCWTQGADVLFARALREAGHLLWATDDALPDVAGRAHAELEAEEMLWNADLPAEVCNGWSRPELCIMHASQRGIRVLRTAVHSLAACSGIGGVRLTFWHELKGISFEDALAHKRSSP